MAGRKACILNVGMITPVGDCVAQTAASVRAGICRHGESAVYNKHFNPMTLALLPEDALPPLKKELAELSGLTGRQIRMLRLAGSALKEALKVLPFKDPLPLFLAGPEPLPDRPPPVTEDFLDHLVLQSEANIDQKSSLFFPSGRAAGMEALDKALDTLEAGTSPYVLLGGVDTFLDLYLLGTLDLEDRVLSEGVMDGFVPGEGAAFLLLASEGARQEWSDGPYAWIHAPGIAAEPGHRFSQEPYRGDGLAQAIGSALENGDGEPVRTVLASLNGENFGAKEWGVATLRNSSRLGDPLRMEHPADCFGDTGAAMGPLLMGLAALGMQKGYLPGPCLVWCASEAALRAAVKITLESE